MATALFVIDILMYHHKCSPQFSFELDNEQCGRQQEILIR